MSEIIHDDVISKWIERAAQVRFEITRLQTKIAQHEVLLPLDYTHLEIAQFNRLNKGY